jgi:ribosomal protein S18 acetylase RimI-like enzyme
MDKAPQVLLRFTRLTPTNLGQVQDLAHLIWHDYYPSIISVDQINYMLNRFFAADALERELEQGHIWELVWIEDRLVGFLACIHQSEQRVLKLSKLYLLPALHGQGIGQKLLARVKELARLHQVMTIVLTVNKRNVRAIRAYARAGFSVAEAICVEIGNGYVMDDYMMRYSLANSVIDDAVGQS